MTTYQAAVWLHLLAAAVWVGGMAFLAFVLVPVLRRRSPTESLAILEPAVLRFRLVGWVALGTLIVTGVAILAFRGIGPLALVTGEAYIGPVGKALGIKLSLVLIALALSALHDFRIGPRALEVIRSEPDGPAAARLRRTASWLGRLTFLLALGILALAVVLVRGGLG